MEQASGTCPNTSHKGISFSDLGVSLRAKIISTDSPIELRSLLVVYLLMGTSHQQMLIWVIITGADLFSQLLRRSILDSRNAAMTSAHSEISGSKLTQ